MARRRALAARIFLFSTVAWRTGSRALPAGDVPRFAVSGRFRQNRRSFRRSIFARHQSADIFEPAQYGIRPRLRSGHSVEWYPGSGFASLSVGCSGAGRRSLAEGCRWSALSEARYLKRAFAGRSAYWNSLCRTPHLSPRRVRPLANHPLPFCKGRGRTAIVRHGRMWQWRVKFATQLRSGSKSGALRSSAPPCCAQNDRKGGC